MLSLYPFVLATPCEGTKNILTEHFQNDIVVKKLKFSFLAILDHMKEKLFVNKNLGFNGLISPRKFMYV